MHDTLPSTKVYVSRSDVEKINQEMFEVQLRELEQSEEMRQVKLVKRQWERELQAEEGDSSYDEEDDFEAELREDEDVDENTQVNKIYQATVLKPQGEEGAKAAKNKSDGAADRDRKQARKLFSDPQQVFGGLPINDAVKIPIIKQAPPASRHGNLKFKANRPKPPKTFSLNEFLDRYLVDDQLTDRQKQGQEAVVDEEALRKEQEANDQYELKNILNIKTFIDIQNELSERFNPKNLNSKALFNHDCSQLNPLRSGMVEPKNLNRDLNKLLNPYNQANATSEYQTTERRILLDVLQMLSLPGLESETFVRDAEQLKVLFRARHEGQGFASSTCVSHLSQGVTKSILEKFVWMANQLQKTLFLFRGIQVNSEQLSTVIQALVFAFNKILGRFNHEVNDLTQILLLQSGQISRSQLTFSPLSSSKVRILFEHYDSEPLTLMRLE